MQLRERLGDGRGDAPDPPGRQDDRRDREWVVSCGDQVGGAGLQDERDPALERLPRAGELDDAADRDHRPDAGLAPGRLDRERPRPALLEPQPRP